MPDQGGTKPGRYLLFAGPDYYPKGGWDDFSGSYDSPEEAVAAGKPERAWNGWWHVIDSETGEQVADGRIRASWSPDECGEHGDDGDPAGGD